MTWPVFLDVQLGLFYLLLAYTVWRRRPAPPMWPALLFVLLAPLPWAAGDIGTLVVRDPAWESFFIACIYLGSFGMTFSWWLLGFRFAEAHASPHGYASPLVVWGPGAWLALGWLLVATNHWHGLFLTPVLGGRNEYQALWWLFVPSTYALLVLTAGGYYALMRRLADPPRARRQCLIMIAASCLAIASNSFYTLLPVEWPFDVTLVGGALTVLLLVTGIDRAGLFQLSPAELREMLGADPSGLVLCRERGDVIYVNERARELLRLGDGPVPGRLEGVLAQFDDAGSSLDTAWPEQLLAGETRAVLLEPHSGAGPLLWVTPTELGATSAEGRTRLLRIEDVTELEALASARARMRAQLDRGDRLRSLGAPAVTREVNPAASRASTSKAG